MVGLIIYLHVLSLLPFFFLLIFFIPKQQVAVVHCMQFLEFGRRKAFQKQSHLMIFALISVLSFVFLICKLLFI